MIFRVAATGEVTLEGADDFRRFQIAMPDTEAARAGLAAVARLDGAGHAWFTPEQVRTLAGNLGPDWDKQFASMTAYAATKGWVDAGGAIRAHIEHD